MSRLMAVLLGALLAACIFAAPVSAEGHNCLWWYPSAVYGGYYAWTECPQPGHWQPYWYPYIPYNIQANGGPYNPIQRPVNY